MNGTNPTQAIDEFLYSLTDDELKFIAARDYGIDADLHLTELRKLLVSQGGLPTETQYWHPYEVIELGAHTLIEGHEREFTACTLLRLRAAGCGFDTSTPLKEALADRATDYRALPAPLGEMILRAYELARLRTTGNRV